MKLKRFFSAALAVLMLIGLLPVSVGATTDYDLWVGGVQVTSDNASNITGTGISGSVSYDADTNTLTLNNATITAQSTYNEGIRTGSSSLTIKLVGSNTITGRDNNGNANYGIYIRGALTFTGDGSLTASAADVGAGHWAAAILAKGDITVNHGCTIVAHLGANGTAAIYPYGSAVVGNSNIPYQLILNGAKVSIASQNADASYPETYTESSLYSYKYLKIEPASSTTYTVTFNANGGSGSMADVTNVSGDYTIPECTFTPPDNMVFEKWQDDSGTYLDPGHIVPLTADLTLIAQWEAAPTPSVTITGTAAVGETLTATAEDFAAGTTLSYQWYRCVENRTPITGATSNTYTITEKDRGYAFYCMVNGVESNHIGPVPFEDSNDGESGGPGEVAPEPEQPSEPILPVYPVYPIIPEAPHKCESACPVCGLCTDARCRERICSAKCETRAMDYSDVHAYDWFYEAVQFVHHEHLMDGIGNGIFDVEGELTRAMMATILWRMEGCPQVDYLMSFSDIPADEWYTEAVRWAASTGIVTGHSDNSFRPTDKLTREQMAAMLWRYAKNEGYRVSGSGWIDPSTSEYAVPAMQWAAGLGMLDGTAPQQNAIRAEIAYALMKLLK